MRQAGPNGSAQAEGDVRSAGAARGREAEREALLRVAAAATGASRLEEVLELAAEESRLVLGAATLSVSRWEREHDWIRTLINVGELGPGEERFPSGETYELRAFPEVRRMVETGEAYFNSVMDPDCAPAVREVLDDLGKAHDVGVAVFVEDRLWGEIWAARRADQQQFGPEDARFLEAVAERCASAIGRAELFSRVSRLAFEDALTKVPNRRAFVDRLERALAAARTSAEPVSLLLCDLDGLKEINDRQGHEAGDGALRAVAAALERATKSHPGAHLARIAGDEFGVLLQGASVERIARLWAEASRDLDLESDGRLSISGGATEVDETTLVPADLLASADAALYMAKREGGGQVCTSAQATERSGPQISRVAKTTPFGLAAARLAENLDGDLAGAGVRERLEAVADGLCTAGNYPAWAISILSATGDTLAELAFGERNGSGLMAHRDEEEYRLDDYPLTAAIMRAGSGAFVVSRFEPGDADAAELALLEEFGFDEVLGASAAHRGETYLLELYGDGQSVPVSHAVTPMRLLVRAAMPPR